jgi:magnesium and cobalt transporter
MNDDNSHKPQSHADDEEQSGISQWWHRLMQRLGGGPRTREDLVELLGAAREEGLIDGDAQQMFEGILQTAELQVRDAMVPRAQMVVVERDWRLEGILPVVVESGHSRFPVIGESRDEIDGILLAKDLLRHAGAAQPAEFRLGDLLRTPVFVPESMRLNVLLRDFRRNRSHMAIVADEYGGVAGLITIEDVLEQIVGEIDDEYDEDESSPITQQDDRRFLVSALTSIEEFNDYFDTDFSDEEFDTVGGLVLHRFGHMPKRGESVRIDRFSFNVQRADSRRVYLFQVTVTPP